MASNLFGPRHDSTACDKMKRMYLYILARYRNPEYPMETKRANSHSFKLIVPEFDCSIPTNNDKISPSVPAGDLTR